MIKLSNVVLSLFVIFYFLINGLESLSLIQARGQGKSNSIPDTMPNAIKILLDNPDTCAERNSRRDAGNKLPCRSNPPYELDPKTYTMDEYALGVIKAEVGGVGVNVTFWHTEAVKAVAVAVRNYVWTHGTEQTDGSLIIGSTTAVQGFFPEKNIGGQAEEERYQLIINF